MLVATSLAGSTHWALPGRSRNTRHAICRWTNDAIDQYCVLLPRGVYVCAYFFEHQLGTPCHPRALVVAYLLLPQLLQQQVGPTRVDIYTWQVVIGASGLSPPGVADSRAQGRPAVASLSPLSRPIVRCSIHSDGTRSSTSCAACINSSLH